MVITALLTIALLAPPQSAPVDHALRDAYFTRVLTPLEGPAVAPPGPSADRNYKRAYEAADAYRKGMIFAGQGAWAEAQKAFKDAEGKNGSVTEYRLSAAFAHLKLHKADDAYKRYEKVYKDDPSSRRALAGMIAAKEDIQHYRDATALWMRYVKLPMTPADLAEARAMLQGARELFAERYEIAENPAGGAPNLATAEQELAWGLQYAQELAASGMTLLDDRATVAYVETMCKQLVAKSRRFPTNYQLFVLDTASVNATTAPGYIFVYRGLLEAAPSEAALAGVLAHEIGHSVAHHGAKKVTRSYQDQEQLAKLQASDSKLSKFLAKMMELGNPVGALTFSRDAEEQADRLAMHIAFDAGFEPEGLADMFQVFEQMEPSSRSSWDLMARTHPFSIDRINTVREYSALFPARTLATTSAAFKTMKARLAKLPPPPDATGLMKAPEAPPAPTGSAPGRAVAATVPYSLAPAPFSGQMPQGWTTKKHSAQTTLFEAPKGTPEGEASIWIRLVPRVSQPDWDIDDYVKGMQQANAKLEEVGFGDVSRERRKDGRELRVLPMEWTGKTSAGAVTRWSAVFAFVDYPDYVAIGQYAAPRAFFDQLSTGFQIVWNSLTYGAETPPAAPAPRVDAPPTASSGRLAFTIESPPYSGEMPEGWVARRNDEVVFIEGTPGTEAYEMTIRLAFYDRSQHALDDLTAAIRSALADLPQASVTLTELRATSEGRPARAVVADYAGKDSSGTAGPFRQVIAIVQYSQHFVVLGYSGPSALHDKYAAAFEMVGSTLKER